MLSQEDCLNSSTGKNFLRTHSWVYFLTWDQGPYSVFTPDLIPIPVNLWNFYSFQKILSSPGQFILCSYPNNIFRYRTSFVTRLTLSKINYFITVQKPTLWTSSTASPFLSKKFSFHDFVISFLLLQSHAPFPGLGSSLSFYSPLPTYKPECVGFPDPTEHFLQPSCLGIGLLHLCLYHHTFWKK